MFEEITNFFRKNKYNNIVINQIGFINSEFYINDAKYKIKDDILTLKNDKGIYIKLNINQIYKIEYLSNGILMCIDNDTKIKLST